MQIGRWIKETTIKNQIMTLTLQTVDLERHLFCFSRKAFHSSEINTQVQQLCSTICHHNYAPIMLLGLYQKQDQLVNHYIQ